jgi:hypothetical protein
LRQEALDALVARPEGSVSWAFAYLSLVVEIPSSCTVLAGISGDVEIGPIGASGTGGPIEYRCGDGASLALIDRGDEDIVGWAVLA